MMIEINKIYNEDCIKHMKTMPDSTIDLIVADPPYNIGMDKWDKIDNYLEWSKEWITEAFRILKPNGSLYIWGTIKNNDFLRLKLWIDETFKNKFEFKNWIIWCHESMRQRTPEDKYLHKHEDLLFYSGNNNTFNPQRDLPTEKGLSRWKGKYDENYYVAWENMTPSMKKEREHGFYLGSVAKSWWSERLGGGKTNNGGDYRKTKNVYHSTTKTDFVCDRIINTSSNIGDLVYIPFAGSGSEIVSCIKNNRNYIATEINKDYIDNAIHPRLKIVS